MCFLPVMFNRSTLRQTFAVTYQSEGSNDNAVPFKTLWLYACDPKPSEMLSAPASLMNDDDYNDDELLLTTYCLSLLGKFLNIHCSKTLREHLKHASDLDERVIQVENLYWCTLYNFLRIKWCNNSQWKPESSTHSGLHSKSGRTAGLMPFYGPVQLSPCHGWSAGISSMLLRLCWETQ